MAKTKDLLVFWCLMALIFSLSIFNLSTFLFPKASEVHPTSKTEVLDEVDEKIQYWSGIANSHPDYFSGWIKLSQIAIEKKDIKLALRAIEKAENINPNSEDLQSLKKKLGVGFQP